MGGIDEKRELRNVHMIKKARAGLARGVKHDPGEAALRHHGYERAVGAIVGEHDADKLRLAGERSQPPDEIVTLAIRRQSDLDVASTGLRQRSRNGDDPFNVRRRLAAARTDRPPLPD